MTATRNRSVPAEAMSMLAQQVEHGYELLRQGRVADAVQLGNELADAHADNVHVFILSAEANLAMGNTQEALEHTDRAISASGGDPFLKLKKGRLLGLLRRRMEVPALAADVAAQADGNGNLLWQLGVLYQRNNLFADAISSFGKARKLIGDHPGLLYDLAVTRFFSGDFEQAEGDLDRMLAAAPQSGPAVYLRATLRRQTHERNHVEDLERRLAAGFRRLDDEVAALYALAKELDDLGEHTKSFAALTAGAAKKRGVLQYDVKNECTALQAVCAAYTADVMAEPVAGHDGEGAIFIVGMPRTGTTLAERMLVQSGRVKAAGELLDFGSLLASATRNVQAAAPGLTPAEASLGIDFAALGRDYMQGARQTAGGSPVFIDKMPVNFLYCGMIRKALPKAKIIHMVRDPLDSCYAVFKTLFFNSYNFSYDLDDLAEYYIAYHRMMRHWHEVMPNRILDVSYEDLVTDTGNQTRRIYDWCGLAWTAEVLEASADSTAFATASAAQVREPVHSRSVGSSRRHAEQMAPLAAKLAAAGIIGKT